MATFTADERHVHILEEGRSACDFMDSKIEELSSVDQRDPFLVGNLDVVIQRHLSWVSNLPRVSPFYAVKCNTTPAVISLLSALGTGFDCASQAEIQQVLSLGVPPNKIIYAHPCKPESHIKYACTHGVQMMTFDSQEELSKIAHCNTTVKLVLRIAVDDSKAPVKLTAKFGASLAAAGQLLKRAGELGLEVIGVSFHVGSGSSDAMAFRQAIADALCVFKIARFLGIQLSVLDIGGGYRGREDLQVKFEETAAVINLALDEFFPPDCGVQIIAEPGRYYVESAFTLAMNVIAKKVVTKEPMSHNNGKDSSPVKEMVYYVNDGVYGSLNFLINDAVQGQVSPYPHKTVEGGEQKYPSVIWGPTCDSLDKITDNCSLPELQLGDWLLVDNVGAYTVSTSTNFNGFKKADIHCVVTAEGLRNNLSAFAPLVLSLT